MTDQQPGSNRLLTRSSLLHEAVDDHTLHCEDTGLIFRCFTFDHSLAAASIRLAPSEHLL